MTVEIDIIDRIYYNIQEFCEVNGFDVVEYMSNAVTERYNLDKYGDLNEKLVKKEEKKPSLKRTKKIEDVIDTKIQETINETNNSVKVEEPIKEETKENKQIHSDVEIQTEEKPKKTRRTLKTK